MCRANHNSSVSEQATYANGTDPRKAWGLVVVEVTAQGRLERQACLEALCDDGSSPLDRIAFSRN